jgi:ATP-dependent DNA helicase RecQ
MYYPHNVADLRAISGVGERKLRRYGDAFLQGIIDYCKHYHIKPKQIVRKPFESSVKREKSLTIQTTLEMYRQNFTIREIAKKRGLAVSTIASHLEKLILDGADISIDRIVDPKRQQHIKEVFKEIGTEVLSPVKEKLGEDYSYEEIRLVRATMMVER